VGQKTEHHYILIYFDLFDILLMFCKYYSRKFIEGFLDSPVSCLRYFFLQWTSPSLRKENKNEGLIRSISGNSNIPVVHQFYKLENSQLKAKKNEVNFSYRFYNLIIRCFCTFRGLAIIFTEVHWRFPR